MATRSNKAGDWSTTFRNILELERANGFNDRAVIGGMDSFVSRSPDAVRTRVSRAPTGRQLLRPRYAGMSTEERAQWASDWLSILDGDTAPIDEKSPEPPPEAEAGNAPVKVRRVGQGEQMPAGATGPLELDSPVTSLKQVGRKTPELLAKLEIASVRDLLYHFPHRYIDYSRLAKVSELWQGQELTVEGQITEARALSLGRSRRKATEAILADDTGVAKITWFGQQYLARSLRPGTRIAVSGRVESFSGRPVFESPEYDIIRPGQPTLNTGRLAPVYPLTAGLTGRTMRNLVWQALESCLGQVKETLPDPVLSRTRLMPLAGALRQAHYPDSLEQRDSARRRLAFEELLTIQLSVLSSRHQEVGQQQGVAIETPAGFVDGILSNLPFILTGAQRRCLEEALRDMSRGTPPMNRLLQGEVGSGKTVVALVALLSAIAAGYQGAIMAPTAVLAEQHFLTVGRLLGEMADVTQAENQLTVYLEALGRPMTVGLLTGSARARPRNRIRSLATEGTLDLLIGTHALIQEGVELPRLALAVMDEQHRFGVMQRSALRQKSDENPHTLVMSATPIPRTLTLTLYGDLDISVIDELPPGRQEILTRYVDPERREAAYGFICREVSAGRQAFIVCPLIDESEAIVAKAAAEEYERLSREIFPELRVGLLHGRMSGAEKDRTMRQFRDGELDILVTTAVVEVGIDVPNATVMLIEGADRFGMAQLHQFRGRVGRGEHKSYCILLSENPSAAANERLAALEGTQDGFRLAEIDLELRGPGDFFGTRQSGLPDLRMARLSDRDLLDLARSEAMEIMDKDPDLAGPEYGPLAAQVARFKEKVSIGSATAELS